MRVIIVLCVLKNLKNCIFFSKISFDNDDINYSDQQE